MFVFSSSQTDVWLQYLYKHGKKKKKKKIISSPNRCMDRKTYVTNMLSIWTLWCLFHLQYSSLFHPKISEWSNPAPIYMVILIGMQLRAQTQMHFNILRAIKLECTATLRISNRLSKFTITLLFILSSRRRNYFCLIRIKVKCYNVLTVLNTQKEKEICHNIQALSTFTPFKN